MLKNIDNKYKKEIVDNLYTIIDINRIGSDEIDCIEDILAEFENLKIKDITEENILKVRKEIIEMSKWSDRLGSDEIFLINRIVKITNYLVS